MTHKDIYTKFMIEYDKANITSSYPSLTPYEVATILDKAYLALIARKLTGNNPRLATFESDIKSIEDLRPLITNKELTKVTSATVYADNETVYTLPSDMLYYLEGQVQYKKTTTSLDEKQHRNELVNLVNHDLAQRFKATNSNLPWIKQPVSFIESQLIHLLIDLYKHKDDTLKFLATYLKKPAKFVDSLTNLTDPEPSQPDTPPVITPGKYEITFTSYLTNVHNSEQRAIYKATASNGVTTCDTTISVIQGAEYVTLTESANQGYVLTVLPTATSTKTIKLRAICNNDVSVYKDLTVNVTYYMLLPAGTITLGPSGVVLTDDKISIYVSTNTNIYPCFLYVMVKHPDSSSANYVQYGDYITLHSNLTNYKLKDIEKTQETGRIQVYLCSSQDISTKFAELPASISMTALLKLENVPTLTISNFEFSDFGGSKFDYVATRGSLPSSRTLSMRFYIYSETNQQVHYSIYQELQDIEEPHGSAWPLKGTMDTYVYYEYLRIKIELYSGADVYDTWEGVINKNLHTTITGSITVTGTEYDDEYNYIDVHITASDSNYEIGFWTWKYFDNAIEEVTRMSQGNSADADFRVKIKKSSLTQYDSSGKLSLQNTYDHSVVAYTNIILLQTKDS